MAKRFTGVGKRGKIHSHKTAKRLAAKKVMLLAKVSGRRQIQKKKSK
ncbi:MAG: hypothetical protein Q8L51_03775 [Candidatus Amesbacteria bacterium]|nr:hypothetical protein [Candidatus Amesbacteria bacterium]